MEFLLLSSNCICFFPTKLLFLPLSKIKYSNFFYLKFCGALGMISEQNSMYGASPIIVLHYPTLWSISVEILLKIDFIESSWDMQKKPLTKNSFTWEPKKRRNRSYVYCFNMLSKIIIGSFGIEYQWLQWCQAAHICHNIRYLLMESMHIKVFSAKPIRKFRKNVCHLLVSFIICSFWEKNWIFVISFVL